MGPGFDSAYPSWYVGTFLIYVSNLNFYAVYCNLLMLYPLKIVHAPSMCIAIC
jgi:hypothetical protein